MNETPPVEYAVPLLNEAPYVVSAVRSLLNQDYPDLTVRVIDAGSTDGTLELLAGMGVKVEVKPGLGQMAAINEVWSKSSAKYIGWWAGDDVLYPGAVSRLVRALEDTADACVAHGDARLIDANGKRLSTHRSRRCNLRRLISSFDLVPQSSLIRRSVLAKSGMMNECLRLAADWDLFLRIAQYAEFVHVPDILSERRLHAGSEDAQDLMKGAEACAWVMESFFHRVDLTVEQRSLENRAKASADLLLGWAAARSGDRRTALSYLRSAGRRHVVSILATPQGKRLLLRLMFRGRFDAFSLTARANKATSG